MIKQMFFTTVLSILFMNVKAQDNQINDTIIEGNEVYFIVEEMPTFQGGGIDEFRKYLMNEIRIPEISVENGISTRFIGRFIVNKEGYIKDVEILRSLDPLVDEEIKRVMLASPKWEPGKQNGIPVNVQYVMPIHITFQ